jgi:hypothetical protein
VNLNDLLRKHAIDPTRVIVFRHSPSEPELKRVLPWFAAEHPDVYNAYQSSHSKRVEDAMARADYIASFVADGEGRTVFVGIYSIGKKDKFITEAQYWRMPAHQEMKKYGMIGFSAKKQEREKCRWFDLAETDILAEWKGRLIVSWPPPGRAWWRWADRNDGIVVHAIAEENQLIRSKPDWRDLNLGWAELAHLPRRWKDIMSQWRGIYYIYDKSVKKGYVGSAYGEDNILGRWLEYKRSGHGGNKLLRQCSADNFRFTILEILNHDSPMEDVVALEAGWKKRLHSRAPFGLNDN